MKRSIDSDHIVREQQDGRFRYRPQIDLADFPNDEESLVQRSRNPESSGHLRGLARVKTSPDRSQRSRHRYDSSDQEFGSATAAVPSRRGVELAVGGAPPPPPFAPSPPSQDGPLFGAALPRARISPPGGRILDSSSVMYGSIPPNIQEPAMSRNQFGGSSLGSSGPIHEAVFGAPPPSSSSSHFGESHDNDAQWQRVLEKEKMKEELFRQFQAGLLQPSVSRDIHSSDPRGFPESNSSPLHTLHSAPRTIGGRSAQQSSDMMDNILRTVMDTGLRNPTQSNLSFLRTPEMRGLLRKIFAREMNSSNHSSGDREIFELLKKEIKAEVEEVTLSSSDEDVKVKIVPDNDLEILGDDEQRKNKKSQKEKRKQHRESRERRKNQRSRSADREKRRHRSSSSSSRSSSRSSGSSRSSTSSSRRRSTKHRRHHSRSESGSRHHSSSSRNRHRHSKRRSRSRSRSRSKSRSRSRSKDGRKQHGHPQQHRHPQQHGHPQQHKHPQQPGYPQQHRHPQQHKHSQQHGHQLRHKQSHQYSPQKHHRHPQAPAQQLNEPKERSDDRSLMQGNEANHPEKLFATVVGFINDDSGILRVTSKGRKEGLLTLFHKENLFVLSRDVKKNTMNVEKCVSPLGLQTIIPMGTGLACYAKELSGDVFQLHASLVWPALSVPPDCSPDPVALQHQLDTFRLTFKLTNYVPLAFDGITPNEREIWSCKVHEIVSQDFGILELISYPKQAIRTSARLYCCFHRSNIWLKNGTPLPEHSKEPLGCYVHMQQSVNIVARSVIKLKGTDLLKVDKKSVHLQALVVSLDPSCIPLAAPRGLHLKSDAAPGTLGIKDEGTTSVLFDRTALDKMNLLMSKFIKETRRIVEDFDRACYIEESDTSKSSRKSRLLNQIARIKKFTSSEAGYMENLNGTWSCVFRVADCQVPVGRRLQDMYKEKALVQLNACLVKEHRKAEYMATSVWIMGKQVSEERKESTLTADQLHMYSQVNNILEGRDPNIQREYYDSEQGMVYQIINQNFGLIKFKDEFAVFKVSEVWMSPESTAANRGLSMALLMPFGTQVFFHCVMLNSTAKVKYLCTAVWKANPNIFFHVKPPLPIRINGLPKPKIEEFRGIIETISSSVDALQVSEDNLIEGIVLCGLQKVGEISLSGGIIEFCPSAGNSKTSLALFSIKSFPPGYGEGLCTPDTKVLFKPIQRSDQIESDISHIGIMVMKPGYPPPPGINTKMKTSSEEILNLIDKNDLLNLRAIRSNLPHQRILIYAKPQHSNLGGLTIGSSNPFLPGRIPIQEVVNGAGILASILNKNFGLIQFRTNDGTTRFCLFDTFDIYVSLHEKASDKNTPITSLIFMNEKVTFHAVEIDPDGCIGWLATGIWKSLPTIPPIIEPDKITEGKVTVFRKVTQTCTALAKEMMREEALPFPPPVVATRVKKLKACSPVALKLGSLAVNNKLNIPSDFNKHIVNKYNAFMPSLPPPNFRVPPPSVPLLNVAPTNIPPPFFPKSSQDLGIADNGNHRFPHIIEPSQPIPPGEDSSDANLSKLTKQNENSTNGGKLYDPSDSYSNYFAKLDNRGKKPVPTEKKESTSNALNKAENLLVEKRRLQLGKLKSEDFYQKYLKVLKEKPTNSDCQNKEPIPCKEVSDGAWEDALRKWKIQIELWLKQNEKIVEDSKKERESNTLLPLTLSDMSTVGEIDEIVGSSTIILKMVGMKDQYAFIDTSRVWVIDHKLFEGVSYLRERFKGRLRINARRVFISGKVRYQGNYAHVGLVPTKIGGFKYTERMNAFIAKHKDVDALHTELEEFARKRGEKLEPIQ